MAQFGVHNEGMLEYPLKRQEDGTIIPDVSVSEIHEYNQQLIENQIEIGIRADELGYEFVVHPENHLKLLAKSSPTPLQVQVAIAQETEDIRLLQMANVLPWHEPVKLAERIGMLDTISDGRAEVGVSTGTGNRERGVFEQYRRSSPPDGDENWDIFIEKLEILVQAWTKDYFEYHSEHHDLPPESTRQDIELEYEYLADEKSGVSPRELVHLDSEPRTLRSISVFPRPKQQPHPQLWKPVGSKRSAIWAAQHGLNACTYCVDFSWVEELIQTYHRVAEKTGWPDHRPKYDGRPFNYGWDEQRGRGVTAEVLVFNTEVATEETFERYKRGVEFLFAIDNVKVGTQETEEAAADAERHINQHDAPIVGDTDEIIDQLARFRDVCGYEDFIVFPTIGVPGLEHEEKLTQMETFAEQVVPYFED